MATTDPVAERIESFSSNIARSLLEGTTDHAGVAAAMATLATPVGSMLAAIAGSLKKVDSAPIEPILALAGSMAHGMPFAAATGEDASAAAAARQGVQIDDPAEFPSMLAELIEDLFAEDDAQATPSPQAREAARLFREIARLFTDFGAAVSGLPGGPIIPKKIIERVEREIAKRLGKLRELIKLLRKILPASGSRFATALQNLVDELSGPLVKRCILGSLVAIPGWASDIVTGGGVLGRDLRSWRDLGIEVHEELQKRYRMQWLPRRFPAGAVMRRQSSYVLQDDFVYYGASTPISLGKAASSAGDGSLHAFRLARLPERLFMKHVAGDTIDQFWGMYREDTVDSRFGEVWEIKPVRSIALGVLQEFHYRHAFNLTNAILLDLRDLLTGTSRGKRALRSFVMRFTYFSREFPPHLIPGQGFAWEMLNTPFQAGAKGGRRPVVIVPLTIEQFSGLVLYMVLDIPIVAIVALSAKLAKSLQEKIQQWLRELAKTLEQILDAIVQFLTIVAFFLALVVVAYLLFVALGALAGAAAGAGAGAVLEGLGGLILRFAPRLIPIGAAAGGATSVAPLASPDAYLREILRLAKNDGISLAAPPRVIGGSLVIQFAPPSNTSDESTPLDISFGPIKLAGLPASGVWILEEIGRLSVAIATGAFAEFLGEPPSVA